MNKKFYILLVILFSFPIHPAYASAPPPSECRNNRSDKCVELSGQTILKDCTPKESNDCMIKDATVVDEGEIVPLWQGIKIKVGNLPKKSWYRLEKSDDKNYLLAIYPNVGKHYLLGSHDFEIVITIQKSDQRARLTCSQVPESGLLSGKQSFKNGPFNIEILHRVNYFYPSHNGPSENPNPSTPEVKKIMRSVLESIRIGKCP